MMVVIAGCRPGRKLLFFIMTGMFILPVVLPAVYSFCLAPDPLFTDTGTAGPECWLKSN